MTRLAPTRPQRAAMTLAAGLLVLPVLAFAQMPASPAPMPANPAPSAVPSPSGMPAASPPLSQATPPSTPFGRAATGTLAALAPSVGGMPGSLTYERQRMSQIIGARVYNDANESIGEIDEVLLNGVVGAGVPGPVAVVQVGGFLGLGGRLVLVPLGDLRWNTERERILLSGATKETLEARPAFEYSALRRG